MEIIFLKPKHIFTKKNPCRCFQDSLSLSLSQYNTMLDPQYMLCPILNEVTQYIFNFYIYIFKKCIGTLPQFDRNVLKKYF